MASDELLEELQSLLAAGDLPTHEVELVLAMAVAKGEWHGADEVIQRNADESVAMRLVYDKAGDFTVHAEPALTDETVQEIIGGLRSLRGKGDPVVWRRVLFAAVPVDHWWRYRDEWQIVPVPPGSPRPEFLLGHHPCVLEVRGHSTPDQNLVGLERFERRAWEIELTLAVVLTTLTPSLRMTTGHTWVIERSDEPELTLVPVYRQEGYPVPQEVVNAHPAELTPRDELERAAEVPTDVYYSRLGISFGSSFDVPELLRPMLDALETVHPRTRDRFLRAAYWFSRSQLAWRASSSLSYISLISALEVLMPDVQPDFCPTCGRDRAPGPTARFRDFVERYAGDVPERAELYVLRSKLVHGGYLLEADRPGGFVRFAPRGLEERDRHRLAERVARLSIIRWLLEGAEKTASSEA